MSVQFLHTRLKVRDLERSIRFYQTHFGFQVRVRHTSGRGSQLAHLRLDGGTELELAYLPWDPDFELDEDIFHIAFQVEDMAQAIEMLRRQGVKITEEPSQTSSGSWIAFIEDPDGYEIELISRSGSTE